jgi:hypothetical protein
MSESEILKVFNNDSSILKSLEYDTINVKNIFQDKQIRQFRDVKDKSNNVQGGLHVAIRNYLNEYAAVETTDKQKANAIMDLIISE